MMKTQENQISKYRDGIAFANDFYSLLGAVNTACNHWTLETNLSFAELSPLCLAIGIEFYNAGYISGLHEFPICSTKVGFRLDTFASLDLVSCEINPLWEKSLSPVHPTPTVILAGLPGSGKSTIIHELKKRIKVYTGTTKTNRKERAVDSDFEDGRFIPLHCNSELEMRRSPVYAIPVRFRGKNYFFPADSLIKRFDSSWDLMVIVDSHFGRVFWRKRLMPDIRIIWLSASAYELSRRLAERKQEETVNISYIEACQRTKRIADLEVSTEESDAASTASFILDWLGLRS